MEIIVKKSTIVRPAEETPKRRICVSNVDLTTRVTHKQTLYFYKKPQNGCSNFFDPQVLREALSTVLVPFYPLAGRLGRDENGRVEIDCNAEGALFVEAEASVVLMDDPSHFISNFEKYQETRCP